MMMCARVGGTADAVGVKSKNKGLLEFGFKVCIPNRDYRFLCMVSAAARLHLTALFEAASPCQCLAGACCPRSPARVSPLHYLRSFRQSACGATSCLPGDVFSGAKHVSLLLLS
jgi:hypothetical protein